MFDVAVIGRGMIGAAAARHLAESGRSVVALGPDEPDDWASWTGPFSSYADEGRITRLGADDPVWAGLAARSIERYADIEGRSGIDFHRACGLLVSTEDTASWVEVARAAGADIEMLDPDEARARTGITLPDGAVAALEGPPSGFVNPRRMVAAQNVLARRAGASIVAQAVESLTVAAGGVELGGPWGLVRAGRAIVATGAWAHHLVDPILDGAIAAGSAAAAMGAVRRPRTVLMAEYDPLDEPAGRSTLPSLIINGMVLDERLERIYWVPPVTYPDGRTYLKIGGLVHPEPEVATGPDGDAELVEWFHGDGDPVEADALRNCLELLLPDRAIRSSWTAPCVYTGTASGYPTVDWVDSDGRVAVVLGGNGSAAKSSDELGRLAASLVTGGALGPSPDPSPDPSLFAFPRS